MNKSAVVQQIDWLTIFIYFVLVFIGWLNIYSTTVSEAEPSIFTLNYFHGRQLFFIGLSVLLIIFVMAIEANFYERFASVIYAVSLLSLLGLFVFGKEVNGARAWYGFGSFGLQPAEFVKATTALALAKYVSDIQTNIHSFEHQVKSFIIIFLPAVLIILQPDPGSALVYSCFFFVLYREGLDAWYLLLGFLAVLLFVATLIFGSTWVVLAVLSGLLLYFLLKKRKKRRVSIFSLLVIGLSLIHI